MFKDPRYETPVKNIGDRLTEDQYLGIIEKFHAEARRDRAASSKFDQSQAWFSTKHEEDTNRVLKQKAIGVDDWTFVYPLMDIGSV